MITALDTETGLASNEVPVPPLVSIAFANEHGSALIHRSDPAAKRFAVQSLEGGIVGAHIAYDVTVMGKEWPDLWDLIIEAYRAERVFDVLIREKLIDIAEGRRIRFLYNLGAVSDRRAGIHVDKNDEWRMRYIELINVPIAQWPPEAQAYAINDATATWAVFEAQERFRGEHSLDVFADQHRQVRKALTLWSQTLIGMNTDPEQVGRVAVDLDERIRVGGDELERIGLARWQGPKKEPKRKLVCDTKAAAAVMVQHCAATGIAYAETEGSGVSLDEQALKHARIPKDHPLDKYRKFKALRGLRTKTIPILSRPVVRTRYDSLKETGRTGSSAPQGKRKLADLESWEWVGTNLQNQAREGGFRECLVPPPGYKYVISDWTGAELVGFSQIEIDLFGHSVMGEALRNGMDPHRLLACRLLQIPYSAYDPKNPEHKAMRQFAKIPNFGFLGGLGAARFVEFAAQYDVELTEGRAKEVKRTWLDTWQTRDYFREMGRRIDAAGSAGATFIQHRSHRIRGGCRYTELCNTPFQGIAADAAGDALWQLWLAARDPSSPLYGCPQVLFVHDENVTLAPVHRAEAVLHEQERIMVEAFGRWCPDVPIKVESVIVDRYLKC